MRQERLLVAPMRLPNQHPKLDELEAAVYFQICEAVGVDNVTFIDFEENLYLYNFIPNGVEIVKSNQWFMQRYTEVKQRLDAILSNVDTVLLYRISCEGMDKGTGSGLSGKFTKDVIDTQLDKCHRMDTYGFSNFGTRKLLPNYLVRMVFLECLSQSNVGVIHLVLDPREIDLSYMIDKDRYKRLGALKQTPGHLRPMPYFEWGLNEIYQQEVGKGYWFYYVGTCRAHRSTREHLFNLCKTVSISVNDREPNYRKSGKISLNGIAKMTDYRFKGGEKGVDISYVSQEKYYYHLKLSRYTFVNRPYQEDSFNYQRFMEAVVLGCIPLIDEKMNLCDLELTYPEFYDIIIKRKLIYGQDDYCNIVSRVSKYDENGDDEIIEEFKKTKAYMALTDINKIRKFWERILGWKNVRFT
jgi:hypothetical protein